MHLCQRQIFALVRKSRLLELPLDLGVGGRGHRVRWQQTVVHGALTTHKVHYLSRVRQNGDLVDVHHGYGHLSVKVGDYTLEIPVMLR